MTEIMERIMSDGAIFSITVFAIGSTIAWIVALPFIIKDYLDERKNIKEGGPGRNVTR